MKNIIENNWVSKWTPGKKEEKDVDLKQPKTFAEYQKKTMSTERILSSDRVLKKLLLVMNLLIFFWRGICITSGLESSSGFAERETVVFFGLSVAKACVYSYLVDCYAPCRWNFPLQSESIMVRRTF